MHKYNAKVFIHAFTKAFLPDAIQELSNIVEHIESLMKEQENTYRMIEIQRCLQNGKPSIISPGRKLIKEGKLNKVHIVKFTSKL